MADVDTNPFGEHDKMDSHPDECENILCTSQMKSQSKMRYDKIIMM